MSNKDSEGKETKGKHKSKKKKDKYKLDSVDEKDIELNLKTSELLKEKRKSIR